MIVTKKFVPRRTVLRGIGATLALPLLDGMVPAFAALRNTAAQPVRRLGVVYVPNGMVMNKWTPATEGVGFDFSPTLKPLEPFRDRVLVLSGLSVARNAGGSTHARASTRFLTGVRPKEAQNAEIQASVSMDQLAARASGQHTQLASLELSLEPNDFAGTCDPGYSCAYTNTISWRGPTTPLPMEHNPRVVFERLFGDSGSTDAAVRGPRLRRDQSLLDSVMDETTRLRRGLGGSDRSKLTEYLEAVRDVERRIQKAEEQIGDQLPAVDQPAGIPATYEEHAKLMFDLQVLAYQCDLTRIITFMMAREISGRAYPEIGVPEGHHPLSHHQDDPTKLASYAKINAFHTALFTYYVQKLAATSDGEGTLLDHIVLLFGCGMSDGDRHAPVNLPILLVGGGAAKGGRHIRYPGDTSLANLHLTLLEKLGTPIDALGDSTGKVELLSV